jgi:hypothetical protein
MREAGKISVPQTDKDSHHPPFDIYIYKTLDGYLGQKV